MVFTGENVREKRKKAGIQPPSIISHAAQNQKRLVLFQPDLPISPTRHASGYLLPPIADARPSQSAGHHRNASIAAHDFLKEHSTPLLKYVDISERTSRPNSCPARPHGHAVLKRHATR